MINAGILIRTPTTDLPFLLVKNDLNGKSGGKNSKTQILKRSVHK